MPIILGATPCQTTKKTYLEILRKGFNAESIGTYVENFKRMEEASGKLFSDLDTMIEETASHTINNH